METRKEKAAEKKRCGSHNCTQAVLCTYHDFAGMEEETIKNVGNAFAAGVLRGIHSRCGEDDALLIHQRKAEPRGGFFQHKFSHPDDTSLLWDGQGQHNRQFRPFRGYPILFFMIRSFQNKINNILHNLVISLYTFV